MEKYQEVEVLRKIFNKVQRRTRQNFFDFVDWALTDIVDSKWLAVQEAPYDDDLINSLKKKSDAALKSLNTKYEEAKKFAGFLVKNPTDDKSIPSAIYGEDIESGKYVFGGNAPALWHRLPNENVYTIEKGLISVPMFEPKDKKFVCNEKIMVDLEKADAALRGLMKNSVKPSANLSTSDKVDDGVIYEILVKRFKELRASGRWKDAKNPPNSTLSFCKQISLFISRRYCRNNLVKRTLARLARVANVSLEEKVEKRLAKTDLLQLQYRSKHPFIPFSVDIITNQDLRDGKFIYGGQSRCLAENENFVYPFQNFNVQVKYKLIPMLYMKKRDECETDMEISSDSGNSCDSDSEHESICDSVASSSSSSGSSSCSSNSSSNSNFLSEVICSSPPPRIQVFRNIERWVQPNNNNVSSSSTRASYVEKTEKIIKNLQAEFDGISELSDYSEDETLSDKY